MTIVLLLTVFVLIPLLAPVAGVDTRRAELLRRP